MKACSSVSDRSQKLHPWSSAAGGSAAVSPPTPAVINCLVAVGRSLVNLSRFHELPNL